MAALSGLEDLVVRSHKGDYRVRFEEGVLAELGSSASDEVRFVIDARVAQLYSEDLTPLLERSSTLVVEAVEPSKSLERMPDYIDHLVAHGVRRGQALVAIGGGITQDIVCFIAATLLRGLDWRFVPTTLLAQADSCIGSKSSINVRNAKNIVGTFTPPQEILIDVDLLETLAPPDFRSGVGEMLKVHAIAGPKAFDEIAADYALLATDRDALLKYISRSLEYKRRLIEADEFDRGVRNVMNYGHTFGHAIESATEFAVPHGIAVTVGMDMANHVAWKLGCTTEEQVRRMRPVLRANSQGFHDVPVPFEAFIEAIAMDKKRTATGLRLVLPDATGAISIGEHALDDHFKAACASYLADDLAV